MALTPAYQVCNFLKLVVQTDRLMDYPRWCHIELLLHIKQLYLLKLYVFLADPYLSLTDHLIISDCKMAWEREGKLLEISEIIWLV